MHSTTELLVAKSGACRANRGERERALEHHAIASRLSWGTRNLPLAEGVDEATEENVRHAVLELRVQVHVRIEGAVFDLRAGLVRPVSC